MIFQEQTPEFDWRSVDWIQVYSKHAASLDKVVDQLTDEEKSDAMDQEIARYKESED